MKHIILLLFLSFSLLQAQERQNSSLTIYNNDLGVVRESREFFTPEGISEIMIKDIPERIIPASVKIELDGEILEQNYRYDLASSSSLLKQYFGKTIKLVSDNDLISGKLVSFNSNQVIIQEENGGIKILPNLDGYRISLESIPENILTQPTLIWQVDSKEEKNQNANLVYQTSGISWKAEYVATINENDDRMDLNTWVNIKNNSGASYKNADLKLIAGDISRVSTNNMDYSRVSGMRFMEKENKNFEEDKLFEYHSYDLNRKVTLLNNEDKQISLFNASDIKIEKQYVYKSMGNNVESSNPLTVFNFKNTKDNNLGTPLPEGVVRIYKKSNKSTDLIGEDLISHTPKDEKLDINAGYAFDIVINEKVEDRKRYNKDIEEIYYEVEIRNRKDENIEVIFQRYLYGDWIFSTKIDSYKKLNNGLIQFKVKVGANSVEKQKYKIRFNR